MLLCAPPLSDEPRALDALASLAVDEIVELVFACVKLIASEPEPRRWVFDEMRDLASVSFRFRDVIEPSSVVMALAASMQVSPPLISPDLP